MDRLQDEAWRGAIPLLISLAEEDLEAHTAPEPVMIMAPRRGYLPQVVGPAIGTLLDASVARRARADASDSVPPTAVASGGGGGGASGGGSAGPFARSSDDRVQWWLSQRGEPVRWHLPVGVVADACAPRRADGSLAVPWKLVLRVRGFPADTVLALHEESTMSQHFLHAMKQSLFLRFGSPRSFMDTPGSVQEEAFRAVRDGDRDAFRAAMVRIAGEDVDDGAGAGRAIAVRVVRSGGGPSLVKSVSFEATEGGTRTLGDVLREWRCLPASGSTTPTSATAAATTAAGPAIDASVRIQGLTQVVDLPLTSLDQALRHPDGTLYVVLRHD